MRVFIQSTKEGIPKNHNHFIAREGFLAMGFETIPFHTIDDLEGTRQDDLIVGALGPVTKKLEEFGINVPDSNYPEELKQNLGRKVWKSTIDEVLSPSTARHVFVKPIRPKVFTGLVLNKETDCPRLTYCEENEPVWCSEVVKFESEWRVFVRYGKVMDVRPYYGDWHNQYNPRIIEKAVNDYTTAPAGYAIDFGVTSKGETLLVEANDGFSIGCYGLLETSYAKLLSARWCELVGIQDECDAMGDRFEWKSRRG